MVIFRAFVVVTSFVAASFVMLSATSCAADLPIVQGAFSGVDVRVHKPFRLEVVSTPGGRAQGLMYRKHLGPTEGMLFLFPAQQRLRFWMKNTLIPLDMIFIDSTWRVAGVVANAVPLTEEPRGVERDSQYVIEVAGGRAKELGIVAGTKVIISGELPPIS